MLSRWDKNLCGTTLYVFLSFNNAKRTKTKQKKTNQLRLMGGITNNYVPLYHCLNDSGLLHAEFSYFYSTLSLIIHQKVQQLHADESPPPSAPAAFSPSCWRIWWADVYLPVCACCTGWRIFCTASVDRQTHCNSVSQLVLVLLLHCGLFVGPYMAGCRSRRGTQRRFFQTHW